MGTLTVTSIQGTTKHRWRDFNRFLLVHQRVYKPIVRNLGTTLFP